MATVVTARQEGGRETDKDRMVTHAWIFVTKKPAATESGWASMLRVESIYQLYSFVSPTFLAYLQSLSRLINEFGDNTLC
jgi:hypothetical protein